LQLKPATHPPSLLVSDGGALNFGLSDNLRLAFPSVVPLLRPSFNNEKVLEPY